MGRLSEILDRSATIGLDTCILICHFEVNPAYIDLTTEVLSGVETGRWNAITSVVTLMEILIRPLQLERDAAAREIEALLVHFPNLQIVEIDREIARLAARIRARDRIRPPDALQIAACRQHGAGVFVTNDRRLERVQADMGMIILDDFLS